MIMAFKGKITRKTSVPTKVFTPEATPISAKYLTLTDDQHTVYFKRLGYQFCPHIKVGRGAKKGHFKSDEALVDMARWPFVIEMYEVISGLDARPRTKIDTFNGLVVLMQICDHNSVQAIFSKMSIMLFIAELKNRYMKGAKGSTLKGIQFGVKLIVRELNLSNSKELESLFYPFPNDSSPIVPYSDQEVKIIVKTLYVIFSSYRKDFLEDRIPEKFPLYDEIELKYNASSKSYMRSALKKKVSSGNNRDTWKLDMVRSAYYLMSFFTGINHSQLSDLKISDITKRTFVESSRGKYVLTTTKNRQNMRQNLDEVGFTKRAKDFIESWVCIAKKLDSSELSYLFPSVVNGKCYRPNGSTFYTGLNHSFQALGLPKLSNRRFRKTKSSLILRATDSIFATAEGLNNKPETVAKHYSDGNPVQTKMALAAVLDVRERTALGESLSDAKDNSIFGYRDPVRPSTYKTIIPTLSPSGMRCTDPFGEKAKSLKQSLINANLAGKDDEVACHKFLECFGCKNHAIIAEVEDVWLMLSFRDVLLGVMSRPSINSMPGDQLVKVASTIESILSRLQGEFVDVYNMAMERYMDAPHPLWSSEDDFELLREIW